jgi:type VI secretion system secreted protein Hcp
MPDLSINGLNAIPTPSTTPETTPVPAQNSAGSLYPAASADTVENVVANAPAANVEHKDFSITKLTDAASPKLHEACSTGKHIPKVIIE